MKIQILKSTQVNQQHCEVMDVVEVDAAMANNLIDALSQIEKYVKVYPQKENISKL